MNNLTPQVMQNGGPAIFPITVEPEPIIYFSVPARIFLTLEKNVYYFAFPLILLGIIKLVEALTKRKLSKTVETFIYIYVVFTEFIIFFFKYKYSKF